MRKDPLFDMEYIYTTYIQEPRSSARLVVNKPASLRDINEKAYGLDPQWALPSLVTLAVRAARVPRRASQNRPEAVRRHGRPLDSSSRPATNTNVIIETLTDNGARLTLAQRYIPRSRRDKRVLLIDGEPMTTRSRGFRPPARAAATS
jgi:glutathione synthase